MFESNIKKRKEQFKKMLRQTVLEDITSIHQIHTPYSLCNNMILKLEKYINLKSEKINIFVLFAPELVYTLIEYGVLPENITFLSDSEMRNTWVRKMGAQTICYKIPDIIKIIKKGEYIMGKKSKIIVGNPPYQDKNTKSTPLWQKFIKLSLKHWEKNGEMCMVCPPAWRKEGHELLKEFCNRKLRYLEIYNEQSGQDIFNCSTRFDIIWLKNTPNEDETSIIIDENGKKNEININKYPFIPHVYSDLFFKCMALNGEEKIKILHNRSMYGNDKKWMSTEKTEKFKFECIHATPCNAPPVMLYSSIKKEHFGVKKVIVGKTSPEKCFYDNGEYGITNNCFGIVVNDEEEANNIIKCMRDKKFINLMNNCKFSGQAIEWKIFNHFKKYFWKENF